MTSADDAPPLLYSAADGVGTITLNRPANRNGMNVHVAKLMLERLEALANDTTVDVVVLTGAGRDFCVGADISGMPDGPGSSEGNALDPEGHSFQTSRMLHELPQVTIAAVRGGCAGAGLGWASACDFRFASDTVVFSTAFLNVAVPGDMGAAWTLPRLLGAARAREMFFFPEKIRGEEALRLGLITRLFPDAEFDAGVADLAAQLAARSPPALRAMKQNFLSSESLSFAEHSALEGQRHREVSKGPHPGQAFRAFLEKRTPVFPR